MSECPVRVGEEGCVGSLSSSPEARGTSHFSQAPRRAFPLIAYRRPGRRDEQTTEL